ncbi:1-aminocyclopropane-1-carboxylate synthase-like protein 1 [Purpureocillium lavendulum]|uniref:1-aminocyclopropane-1-carboxylate synthase-like protein 1 n=1 Tax=Purpureocillium lavendulum TaxID=1247861 RepID=A0AB34G158_9HYPO|nr:1-aminocyclopropane-1-carboxylate synthase-like protein 1 [Purpureocillium lavendulum]
MSDGELLAGLDEVPWGTLKHAYGQADDVPQLLRDIAGGDNEQVAAGVYDLFGNIWHQGTVYEATSPAVPFITRLAVAGVATASLVQLLGLIAESRDNIHDRTAESTRSAVASQAGMLCSLLDSPEVDIRIAVTTTVTESGPAEIVGPLLRRRWDIEQASSVRASILRALFVLDPAQGATLAGEVLTSGTATERLLAAWIQVTTGSPWSDDLDSAATAWFKIGDDLDDISLHGRDTGHPFTHLLFALCKRGDLDVATGLSVTCLGQAPTPGVQEKALSAIEELTQHYRISMAKLGPAIVPLVGNGPSMSSALNFVRTLNISGTADDTVSTSLGDQLYHLANVRGPDLYADQALDCLFLLGDSRAPSLLATDLAHRPSTLFANAQASGEYSSEYGRKPIGFDLELLHAIRRLLRTSAVAPPGFNTLRHSLPEGTISHNLLTNILTLLAAWGSRAAPAVLEIISNLPRAAYGAKVLAAIGDPGSSAIESVRALADSNNGDLWARLTAATALHDLTGEVDPLLEAIRDSLQPDQSNGSNTTRLSPMSTAISACLTINDPPPWLVPALRAVLSSNERNQVLQAEVHRALCRFTGDVSGLAELLQYCSRFGSPIGGYSVLEAAYNAGVSATPLIPHLAKFLNEGVYCAHAAKAIMSAGLGELDLDTVADKLVQAVGNDLGPNHGRALDLLREIRRRDRAAITPAMLARLRDLTERPTRIIREGRSDEALCRMICKFLDEMKQDDK